LSGGISPGYLAKLTPIQQQVSKRAVGVKLIKEFVWNHGQHCFVFGTTGSGKTQKGYWLVNWLMHTESIIWISSGKPNEILPLFTLGKKVRIIIPEGSEFIVRGKPPAPYEIVEVSSPIESWRAVRSHSWDKNRNKVYDTINVFEFRNTISDKYGGRSEWMRDLFQHLALGSRIGTMPKIFPCAIFLDEAQWLVTGRRISQEGKRMQTSESITENVLEMRSAGCRFVMFAQSYTNVPPALRENMLFSILCRGADVKEGEHSGLAYHCRLKPGPSSYQPNEGKFVYPEGSVYPAVEPWKFSYFPAPEGCEVLYGKHYVPKPKEPDFVDTFPEDIGLYNTRLTKPKPEPLLNRWSMFQTKSNQ